MISSAFRRNYVEALDRHTRRATEATLRDGYELGRRAVAEGCSALELAAIHHEALAASLPAVSDNAAADVVVAAASFFEESLSAFEMVHRGFREVASAAAAERRSAAMLRRLSSFLADASLSARQTDAEVEVLHLVAEHARELTDAIYASATWSAYGKDVRARSLDLSTAEAEPEVLERLEAVGKLLPTRLSRIDWPAQPALRDVPPSNALSVPLTALDGEPIGLLLLVEKRTGEFTVVDEAVAVHLAEMTAAALERVELYRSPARG
jgi:hypothetical protein